MIELLAAALVGLGLSLIVVAALTRGREREEELLRVLEMASSGPVEPATAERANGWLIEPGVAIAHAALERLDPSQRLQAELTRARIPLRPGEFVLLAIGVAIVGGTAAGLLTGQWLVAAIAFVGLSAGAWIGVSAKANRRSRAIEEQLPDSLSVIASSLEAGHTFLRAVEMMVEESEPPLSEEFERVLTDVQLGGSLVDAMQRMAERVKLPDLSWVVQAIRIQQTVGGRLAELLMTLAGFMRAREELRREVQVLTAEGRMSARVLGLLPISVFVVIRTMNPSYVEPLLSGTGLVLLIGAAVSVLTGILVIRRMARVDM